MLGWQNSLYSKFHFFVNYYCVWSPGHDQVIHLYLHIIIIVILLLARFLHRDQLAVFHWNLLKFGWPRLVVKFSKPSSPLIKRLGIVLCALMTIGITVTFIFHGLLFCSMARSKYLSLFSFFPSMIRRDGNVHFFVNYNKISFSGWNSEIGLYLKIQENLMEGKVRLYSFWKRLNLIKNDRVTFLSLCF